MLNSNSLIYFKHKTKNPKNKEYLRKQQHHLQNGFRFDQRKEVCQERWYPG